MNIRMLLLGCLLALPTQAQESRHELWTWIDANGVTHFADRPVPGARRVEITTTTPPPRAESPAPGGAARSAQPAAAVAYRSLEIWQPENDESFLGGDARVNVRVRSDPELATGHTLLLYLDGRLVEGATNSESYTLAEPARGAHSLVAVITDERGNERIRSEPRVFHVRQPTINQPNAVGPIPRPPPVPMPRVPPVNAPRGG